MKKKTFTILLTFLTFFSAFTQTEADFHDDCLTSDPQNSSLNSQSCSSNSNFNNPYYDWFNLDNSTPIKTVRINFVFLRNSNGDGGFDKNSAEHQSVFSEIMTRLNNRYASLNNYSQFCFAGPAECYDDQVFWSDTKIRFVANYINIDDDYYWNSENNNGLLCPTQSWYLSSLSNTINNDPNIEKGIIVYIPANETIYDGLIANSDCTNDNIAGYGCSELPSFTNLDRTSQIAMPDAYLKYHLMKYCIEPNHPDPWSVIRGWFISSFSKTLAHELGHSLSWGHCNRCNGDCTIFNPHLMNQCGGAVGDYISPGYITRAHRALAMSNIRDYVVNCEANTEKIIDEDELWDVDLKLYRNVRVTADNTLTIKCKLEMLENGKIIVEPGGKLIVDDGLITRARSCDGLWSGIEVHGTSSLVQNSTNSGTVKLINGAIIEYAYNGIRTIAENNGNLDWSKTGGIIECDDATFLNCRRGIEFMSYHNTNSSGVESNNASYISKGKFITDSELPNNVNPAVGISMFDVKGVTIKNCLFENQRTDLNSIDITERGSGIFSIDASYNVESGYALGTGNPVAGTENKFSNLFYGVMTTGGTSISKVRVMDNNFTNCAYGIGLHGCNHGVIGRNDFDMPGADYSFQDPYTGNWYNYGMGVYSIGSYGFNIEANEFTSYLAQSNYNDLGVYSDNSSHVSSGKVYRNEFRNVTLGTQTTNNNLLLTYNCNDHTKGSISTFDLHAAGGDLADQGTSFGNGSGVKNTANSCNNQTLHQVYKGLSNDFFYFYETGSLSSSCHNIGTFAQVNPLPNGCESTLRNRFTTSVPTTVENLEASLLIINDSITSLEGQLLTAKGREKDTLESAIRVYNNYRLNTINDVVTAYLDTMWIDSAASFLKNEGSVESMMMLVNIEMQRDTAEVMDYLEAIRDKADSYAALGDDPRVPEMRAFCNYQEFLLPIVNRTGSYYSLTADEKDTIAAYADSSVAVSANARAIEYFLDEKQPVVQGADLPEMERWANPENTNQAIFEDLTLTAVPNPTHGEVEFVISGINTEKCEVSVTDMQGRIIGTAVVNDGSATFDFTSHPSGVYFGKLLKNGELVGTIKVMNAH